MAPEITVGERGSTNSSAPDSSELRSQRHAQELVAVVSERDAVRSGHATTFEGGGAVPVADPASADIVARTRPSPAAADVVRFTHHLRRCRESRAVPTVLARRCSPRLSRDRRSGRDHAPKGQATSDQALPKRVRHGVGTIPELKPRRHVVQDVLDGALGVCELLGDLRGVTAIGHQSQDLDLTGGETCEREPPRSQHASLQGPDLGEQPAEQVGGTVPSLAAAATIVATRRSAVVSLRRISPTAPASTADTSSPSSREPATNTVRVVPPRCSLCSNVSVSSSTLSTATTVTHACSRSSSVSTRTSGRGRR